MIQKLKLKQGMVTMYLYDKYIDDYEDDESVMSETVAVSISLYINIRSTL